jgi:N-acetylmuramoyl-L-alanine amidase
MTRACLLSLAWLLLFGSAWADPATVFYLSDAPKTAAPVEQLMERLGYRCVLADGIDPAAALVRLRSQLGRGKAHRLLVIATGKQVAGALGLLGTGDLSGMITLGGDPPPAERRDVPLLELKANPDELLQIDSSTQKAVRGFLAENAPEVPIGLPNVEWVASPNWGVRPLNGKIDTVVVHATVIDSLAGTEVAFLDDKKRRVSAHYVIDRDGRVIQMVDERVAAWHAGVSELDGRQGVNAFSVGVELVNRNDGKDPYPEAQVAALARIIRHLREHWDIPDSRIVSHAFVARPVGRKSDPLGFDFAHLRQLLGETH